VREELATVQRDLEASRVIRSELALELANATTNRKLAEERLETERLRAEELIKQIEEKEQARASLTAELEETRNELVSRETQLQQALQSISSPAVVSGENETTEALQDEIHLGVRQRLIEFVGERKSQAKDTRNWFQAKKMIAELERILSIE